jgi:hypothetical protein
LGRGSPASCFFLANAADDRPYRIGVVGMSMGGGVACIAAGKPPRRTLGPNFRKSTLPRQRVKLGGPRDHIVEHCVISSALSMHCGNMGSPSQMCFFFTSHRSAGSTST